MLSSLQPDARYIAVQSVTRKILAKGRLAIEALARADAVAPNDEIEIIRVLSNSDSPEDGSDYATCPTENVMKKVLIAEDDFLMADMLEEVLTDNGYEVCGIARNVNQGVELAEKHRPDILLLDLRLADGDLGSEIVARIPERHDLGIIYLSGVANKTKLSRQDGHGFLRKPYRPDEVLQALKVVEAIVDRQNNVIPAPGNLELFDAVASPQSPQSPQEHSLQIEKLLRRQIALTNFGSFALQEQDLSCILNEAARTTAESLGVPFSKICRYRSEENDLFVEAGAGWKAGVVGNVVSRADMSSPQGRAFTTGDSVICNDISLERLFILPAFYIEHKIVSTLDVVIRKRDGTPWGVLEIDNPVQCNYDEHDVIFMIGFANILAEAVETSKRNIASKAAVSLLNDVVAERDRLNSGPVAASRGKGRICSRTAT